MVGRQGVGFIGVRSFSQDLGIKAISKAWSWFFGGAVKICGIRKLGKIEFLGWISGLRSKLFCRG